MELVELKDALLSVLALGVSAWIVSEIHALRKSVEGLNVSLAVLLSKWQDVEARVERIEAKLD